MYIMVYRGRGEPLYIGSTSTVVLRKWREENRGVIGLNQPEPVWRVYDCGPRGGWCESSGSFASQEPSMNGRPTRLDLYVYPDMVGGA